MPSAKPITGAVLGALVLIAVGAAPARADKCTAVKVKAIGKKESGLLSCYAKLAASGDPANYAPCVGKVEGKYFRAFSKAGSCAGFQDNCETVAQDCASMVRANLPDAGPSNCEAARLKAAGKKAAAKMSCNASAAGKGLTVDPACIQKVEATYQAAFGKTTGCTGDQQTVETTVDQSCVSAVGADPTGGGTVGSICLHVQP